MSADNAPDQLVELAATNLGVIEQLTLLFGPGMTAITGETGAGKTLVLTALQLLAGGRADATMVGPHGDEAVVEGRFQCDGDELVLRRVVPRNGRSRAYVNGSLATAASLAEYGARIVEVHGQHGHTGLTATAVQRLALDRFAGIDTEPLARARAELRTLLDQRTELGGDERERLRQIELYRFQVDEIDAAAVTDDDEDQRLRAEEAVLGDATAHQDAAAAVADLLSSDGPAETAVGQALELVRGRAPLGSIESALAELAALIADAAADARTAAEHLEADPERLAQIQERRRVLSELRRKYGETLADVADYRADLADRLAELVDHDRLAAEIGDRIAAAEAAIAAESARVRAARVAAAPALAERIGAHLHQLALPTARLHVEIGPDAGDDVELLVSMNTGAPPLPLAKIASGGELARTMLALRLVLSAEPATMVFDEVDAGIGGEAAHSVGAALARLGRTRQVLVVTHLAQVAAFADQQVSVVKSDDGSMVTVAAAPVEAGARVIELSRMLSGSPDSDRAREHAAELLAAAGATLEREP